MESAESGCMPRDAKYLCVCVLFVSQAQCRRRKDGTRTEASQERAPADAGQNIADLDTCMISS